MFRRSTDETRIESRSQAQDAYAAEWVGRVGGVQSQSARGVTSREDRGLGVSQCARETILQRECPMTWDGRRCHRMPPRCCRPGPGVSRLKESARSPSFSGVRQREETSETRRKPRGRRWRFGGCHWVCGRELWRPGPILLCSVSVHQITNAALGMRIMGFLGIVETDQAKKVTALAGDNMVCRLFPGTAWKKIVRLSYSWMTLVDEVRFVGNPGGREMM
ncbi:hypothetical protein CCUS01_15732 [Colletotrichum cuscutae]|uniref:Uncharacterized protein n=1 Tax=Colletotrichum cuscutae TaxID=1209917 RepID=A0AAI9VDN0_9PEZI|nr:hypothetical protein CCUS01_15732 [Colletotrichum cuscutae]